MVRALSTPSDAAPHLLVVDDDRRIRDLLLRFLSGEGYRVTTAETAAEAHAKLGGLSFDLLRITKQSLGRVLRDLVQQGYVVQKAGENDRRQRLLFVTAKGEALAMRLAKLQTERILRALGDTPGAHDATRRFLAAMIEPKHRQAVLDMIARADRARRLRR